MTTPKYLLMPSSEKKKIEHEKGAYFTLEFFGLSVTVRLYVR
jgi:hypothetical protein